MTRCIYYYIKFKQHSAYGKFFKEKTFCEVNRSPTIDRGFSLRGWCGHPRTVGRHRLATSAYRIPIRTARRPVVEAKPVLRAAGCQGASPFLPQLAAHTELPPFAA
ncbi:hypothetical protein NN561_012347 [Cricetulus griseus]